MTPSGKFVISLDFELMWGMRDNLNREAYAENIHGVYETLPVVLELFTEYGIRATFATVGFLFAKTKEELHNYSPRLKPTYEDENLSPYKGYFNSIGQGQNEDQYHYATSLIQLIKQYPDQEIATHTYSHYYCGAEGQTVEQFESDLEAAINISEKDGVKPKSIVFPRNQFRDKYLASCKDLGIISYRGNEKSWIYNTPNLTNPYDILRRASRFADRYINLTGNNCYVLSDIKKRFPYCIASSRFLGPYNPKLKFLEPKRLIRILKSMTHAAVSNQVFHLWWHPHNFGKNQVENLANLESILDHYRYLNQKHGFESHSMNSLSEQLSASIHDA